MHLLSLKKFKYELAVKNGAKIDPSGIKEAARKRKFYKQTTNAEGRNWRPPIFYIFGLLLHQSNSGLQRFDEQLGEPIAFHCW